MKRTIYKTGILALITWSVGAHLYAQGAVKDDNVLNNGILIVGVLVVLAAIIILSENLLKVEAKRNKVDTSTQDTSLFPGLRRLFRPKPPEYVGKEDPFISLNKGFNILLDGGAEEEMTEVHTSTYAVQPPNFKGIAPIPKMMVSEGDEVRAGDPLFFNKKTPDIYYTAPVSGEVASINRGAKRAITEVVILADKDVKYKEFAVPTMEEGREKIVEFLKSTGFWPYINSRPFDVVPDPNVVPRDIFISTFDSAPLSANLDYIVAGQEKEFQQGLDVLTHLTDGDVYLGLNANGKQKPSPAFVDAEGVKKYWFRGKHPAGNVGVQIHHIKPIRAGDTLWTLGVQEVIMLGRLFLTGKFIAKQRVAICGENVKEPHYVETYVGAKIGELIQDNLKDSHSTRLVSGDLLTGEAKTDEQFINARENELTTATEGDYHEMFGWLIPSTARPSVSRTYPNFLFPDAVYEYDTNTHGENRAFVMTGQYEAVLPMDIYPQHLMKAIMAQDFEQMEGLGIYELSEEDVALCEFACTSKQPLQQILREGLDLMREQG